MQKSEDLRKGWQFDIHESEDSCRKSAEAAAANGGVKRGRSQPAKLTNNLGLESVLKKKKEDYMEVAGFKCAYPIKLWEHVFNEVHNPKLVQTVYQFRKPYRCILEDPNPDIEHLAGGARR